MTKEQWERETRAHLHEYSDGRVKEIIRRLRMQNMFGTYTDFIIELEEYLESKEIIILEINTPNEG